MLPWWLLAIAVFGTNFALWGTIGLLRAVHTALCRPVERRKDVPAVRTVEVGRKPNRVRVERPTQLTVADVAVLIPAHNEESVIVESIKAITALVPLRNVHVVSDGSTDRTIELARKCGVHVISTSANVGKAGALQEAFRRFRIVERFKAVMLLDADTQVDPQYFQAALPFFSDPEVVALAGCVQNRWEHQGLGWFGKLVALHRARIYLTTQFLLKYGQTWRHCNATHIVPGFASIYRTDVLPLIDVNPPGLVIEDFNMTFEVYQKRLGKVAFTPRVVARTQDPGTFKDYVRQCRRWALGLWQTVRRHPPRLNLFSAMLGLLILELLSSSIMLLLLPLVVLVLFLPELFGEVLAIAPVAGAYGFVSAYVNTESLLYGVVLPDLGMTCVVALVLRQPRYLIFGWFFLLMRVLDAAIGLAALPAAYLSHSTGRWRSPSRRATGPAAAGAVEPTGTAGPFSPEQGAGREPVGRTNGLPIADGAHMSTGSPQEQGRPG
jgi:biofilm PGA synthesis N-glycosyltransferase PgaC